MQYLPKLNQLRIFQLIIKHGSIRAAAAAANQTQPALTRAMNELERSLGVPLIVRGGRGVTLTEAGKLFLPRMQLVLRELERAAAEVGQLSYATRGTVAFGSSSITALTMLPTAIQNFQRRFSQVNIHLSEGHIPEMLEAVRAGALDFAIGATLDGNIGGEFIEEPFFNTPFFILARRGHPLADSTSLEKLTRAKWYLPTSTMGYYHQLNQIIFPEGQNDAVVVRGNTAITAVQLVMNADFLTVGSKEVLNIPYLKEHICYVPIKESLPDASFNFIYSQRLPLTMVARNMMNTLRKEFDNCSQKK